MPIHHRDSLKSLAITFSVAGFLIVGLTGCTRKDNAANSNLPVRLKPAPIITPPKPTGVMEPGRAAMVRRLAELNSRSSNAKYFGDGTILAAQQRLEAATKADDFFGKLQALQELGSELTLAGRADEALATLTKCQSLLPEVSNPSSTGPTRELEQTIYIAKALAAMRKASRSTGRRLTIAKSFAMFRPTNS